MLLKLTRKRKHPPFGGEEEIAEDGEGLSYDDDSSEDAITVADSSEDAITVADSSEDAITVADSSEDAITVADSSEDAITVADALGRNKCIN